MRQDADSAAVHLSVLASGLGGRVDNLLAAFLGGLVGGVLLYPGLLNAQLFIVALRLCSAPLRELAGEARGDLRRGSGGGGRAGKVDTAKETVTGAKLAR